MKGKVCQLLCKETREEYARTRVFQEEHVNPCFFLAQDNADGGSVEGRGELLVIHHDAQVAMQLHVWQKHCL